MRRRLTVPPDNAPINFTVSETITPGDGTLFIETGTPVSWAIVLKSGVSSVLTSSVKGLYNVTPNNDSDTTYNVENISGETDITYQSGTLQVFLNGTLLKKGRDYTEDANLQDFDLVISSEGIPVAPNASTDTLQVLFFESINSSVVSGEEAIRIKSLYPTLSTGILVEYFNISASNLTLSIIYR